jgi:hypothetical protein
LPQSYKYEIEFDEIKSFDETIKKDKMCHEQRNNKSRGRHGRKSEKINMNKGRNVMS